MNLATIFSSPLFLWLLPLAFLPLVLDRAVSQRYSWVAILPKDRLSELIGLLLKVLAVLALIFTILGLAGPHSQQQHIQRIGVGAQIALVLDRSASMDDPFSGETSTSKVGETKSVAASRLITNFVKSRQNDMFGMVTFSNSAMYVLPLSENREAILAAVQATAGNALFQTNIGSGITSGAGLFNKVPDSGSRAMILLSDGGGRIDADTQQKIRDWLDNLHIGLYWIVLRQPGGLSIFDTSYVPPEDSVLPPQIELNEFFKTLKSPFHAYEADDPKSLAAAIADINQKEKKPIRYIEQIPGKDFSSVCFLIAALMIGLLLAVKYLEVRSWD
ncbi:MAG: VWA domain-containing protein [Methylophilaceae bacterium]|jgi:mxaC protein|nr:VWA domain-containing protein [Methylophilaceae bacterium]NCA27316.1 VWA domain-containing protein [Methylophilaceae bacterium]